MYASNGKMKMKKKKLVVMDYISLDIIIVATYCYLQRKIYKVLKFQMNNSSYFKISVSLF